VSVARLVGGIAYVSRIAWDGYVLDGGVPALAASLLLRQCEFSKHAVDQSIVRDIRVSSSMLEADFLHNKLRILIRVSHSSAQRRSRRSFWPARCRADPAGSPPSRTQALPSIAFTRTLRPLPAKPLKAGNRTRAQSD
jgi:hypothetical protein